MSTSTTGPAIDRSGPTPTGTRGEPPSGEPCAICGSENHSTAHNPEKLPQSSSTSLSDARHGHPGVQSGRSGSQRRVRAEPRRAPHLLERAPYGCAAAIDGFRSVAAPLLAGFAIAVVGITVPLTATSPVRYPGTAIAFTALSALMLLASVQCTMWARQYAIHPNDMLEWWPDAAADQVDRAARLRICASHSGATPRLRVSG